MVVKIVCWKRPKIIKKEARVGPFVKNVLFIRKRPKIIKKRGRGCPIFKQKCQPNLEILPKRAASGERDLGVDLVLEVALKDAEVDVEIGLILNCGERVD